MMKDVLLFLITFTIIMVAFASGVSYIFNMASGKSHNYLVFIDLEHLVIYILIHLYTLILGT